MNIKQIQFNRQKVVSFLLAGVILALTAGLAWTDVSLSQPNWDGGSERADIVEHGSELPSESPLRLIAVGKLGSSGGADEF